MSGISKGDILAENQTLGVAEPEKNIRKVEYVGFFEDVNFKGDGVYEQWQYHYFRGQVVKNIGTANMYPFKVNWNTSWVPDQKDIKVAARVVSNSGLIYFTEAIENLSLQRDYSVELAKPYDQPKNWVTRQDEFSSKIKN